MKKKIYDIAIVQTGVFAKKSPTPNAVYLQQSDFDEEGNVDVSLCPTIEVSDKYMLNSGDLLVVCKGGKNQCVEVPEMGYKAVASSSFLVLRINDKENVLPAYVAWFLNLSRTQRILMQQAKGSAILSISKNVLGEIEIPIPSVEKQQQCLQLAKLYKREQMLCQAIMQKRSQLFESKIINNL